MEATLTAGPISRRLLSMAIPMAGGLLATMSFNIVDTYFVSMLGENALAALSFTFPVVMLFLSLAIGLGAGASSIVAIAAGEGDTDAVKNYITDSLSLAAVLSAACAFVGFLTIEPLFIFLGATEDILLLIHDYMNIWYFSAIFLTVPMVGFAAFRALGNTRLQANIMIGMAISNAVLDPILIFGLFGFPRLEVQGAAIATLIVRLITLFLMFYFLGIRHRLLVNPCCFRRALMTWKRIFRVGLPAMATNMIIPASGAVLIAMIAKHGPEAVAGFGVASRVEAIALIGFYALSGVIGPFCGQNLGARNFDRILEAQRLCARFCLFIGILIASLLVISAQFIGALFSNNSAVVEASTAYFYCVPISYCAYGVVMVANASFNGLGKPVPGVILSSSRVIFLLLPIAWFVERLFGVVGIFIAITAANIIVGVWAYYWLKHTVNTLACKN